MAALSLPRQPVHGQPSRLLCVPCVLDDAGLWSCKGEKVAKKARRSRDARRSVRATYRAELPYTMAMPKAASCPAGSDSLRGRNSSAS